MSEYDVVVVGAGPGGYVAAIRAAQLGMKTAVVEEAELGGICLNWGCIPSKALLRNAQVLSLLRRAAEFGIQVGDISYDFGKAVDRSRQVVSRLTTGVGYLLRKNKVEIVKGRGRLAGAGQVQVGGDGRTLQARSVILATGARPRGLAALPFDGKLVVSSREALEARELPESAVIVGGGAVGCEFAYIYNAYGVKVTMVELLPRLLPGEDPEVSQQVERSFKKQGITLLTGSSVRSLSPGRRGAILAVEAPGGEQRVEAGRVLVAVGVQGNVEGLGLEEAGVATERGFVAVDERMRTSVPSVYAIGDVTGKLLLAHVASAQGVAVVEALAGREAPPLDYSTMPRAVYCEPQVASWGLTEEAAREAGYQVAVGRFPLSASGKALALGEAEGFAKVVVDAARGEILGAHLVGPEVTELLPELSMARALEGTVQEVGAMVHAHPTLSEAIKEAALDAMGQAIHI